VPGSLGHAGPFTAAIAAAGATNAGNWTLNLQPQDIGVSVATFECYHIVVNNGPIGGKFQIFIGGVIPWDTVFPGWDTSWDPNQTMKLTQGQHLSFRWNTGTGTAPEVTLFFQESSPL
jgi:hypothetical protein